MRETRRPSTVQAGYVEGRAGLPFDGKVRAVISDQQWLEPIADAVQDALGKVMSAAGKPVTDFLHGTWLRHPLHVALTDVPIGAWTAGVAMDLLDLGSRKPKYAAGADAAVALGIAAAVPTALSGLADWRHVNGYPRRVGLMHATFNTVSLLLQIASLAMRVRGKRSSGVALSSLGYLATIGAAWLGGELVEEHGIGVNHTAFQKGPDRFVPVMSEDALQEGHLHRVKADGVEVLLFRREGQIYAIAETCSHQGGPLAEGRIEDDTVICPWHGSQYRLTDGTLVHGPSTFDQPRYEVRIENGQIEVRQARMGE